MGHAAEDLQKNATAGDVTAAETVLACSRCDGPVSEQDLGDGIAVRIDGQPVCQVCIETLPPGLRVQINRVRALKGLAVTTYRVQHPSHARGSLFTFTFTNAGLLMLHRRALTSGTEFATPDLPAQRPPSATGPQPAAPAPRRLGPLLVMGGVAVAVISGIAALVLLSGPGSSPGTKPAVVHAPEPVAPVPVPSVPESQPRLLPMEPPAPAPGQPRTLSEYLAGHTTLEALAAAEHDGAPADIRERLVNEVIRERTNELTAAAQFLQKHNFTKVTKLLDQTRVPTDRSEFSALIESEATLRHSLEYQLKALATVTPDPVPVALPDPGVVPPVVPAPVKPEVDPAVAVATPVEPVFPVAKPPTRSKPLLTAWNGPLLLKDTTLLDLDGSDSIPAPWPTMRADADVQFLKSAYLPGSGKKRVHQVVLGISAEQVVDGGIGLVLNSNYNRKGKTIHILRDDQQVQDVVFDEVGWRFVALPLPPGADTQIRLRFEDAEELSASASFWVGQVTLVRGAEPTAESAGLLPITLLTGDVSLSLPTRRTFQSMLQLVAKARGIARWNDPKAIAFKEAKILLADAGDMARAAMALPLRERWTKLKTSVPYTVEQLNLDPAKTFAGLQSQPTKNQMFVVMVPNGSEATFNATDWEKRVIDISTQLLEPPKGRVGAIPVWVMGSLDGKHPVDPQVWSKVRAENRGWIVIDLTLAGTLAETKGQDLIADALKTLAYQFRQAQTRSQ